MATDMKVALVHDYLNQFGGAERVLFALADIFPEAPIYTLFYEPGVFNHRLEQKTIKTTFLDRPFIRRNHRLFIPLFAKAAEKIKLEEKYDLVLSDSAGFAKAIHPNGALHVAYIHTPLRYAWEPDLYLDTLFPKPLVKAASPIFSWLKRWDKRTAQKPDLLLANSYHTASRIQKFYGREAKVIYPPVDNQVFYPELSQRENSYFLAFGRLIHYKRFDLTINAFNKLGLPLKIVGSGPEQKEIKKMIKSDNIEMIPEIKDEDELRKIINGARAVVFPQLEDFGLSAAESIACGTPVIAYAAGGALEIIEEGVNGLFSREQNEESLIAAVNRFQKMAFDRKKVAQSADLFSAESFKTNLLETLSTLTEIPKHYTLKSVPALTSK